MKHYTWKFVARDARPEYWKFRCPDDVRRWAMTIEEFKSLREQFWIVTVDTRNKLVGYEAIGQGHANGSLVHCPEVPSTVGFKPQVSRARLSVIPSARSRLITGMSWPENSDEA